MESRSTTAFEKLKEQFLERPILQMVDQDKPFEIEVDASAFATGAVLIQRDSNGDKHPQLTTLNLLTPPNELSRFRPRFLAIIRALKEWRHYLEGSPHSITIWSDHENLTRWREPNNLIDDKHDGCFT